MPSLTPQSHRPLLDLLVQAAQAPAPSTEQAGGNAAAVEDISAGAPADVSTRSSFGSALVGDPETAAENATPWWATDEAMDTALADCLANPLTAEEVGLADGLLTSARPCLGGEHAAEVEATLGVGPVRRTFADAFGEAMGRGPVPAEPTAGMVELTMLMENERLTVDQIARARELIVTEVAREERVPYYEDLQTKVEYRNQRNNESRYEGEGGGTCNVTALAMCLMYLGVANPNPEMQYEDALAAICDENGWDIEAGVTWEKLGRHLGVVVEARHEGQGVNGRDFYEGTLAGWLQGGSVLVSIHGHIVRVQAVTETGIVVDDPYAAHELVGTTGRNCKDAQGQDMRNGRGDGAVDGTDASNLGEDLTWVWDKVLPFDFKCFYTVQGA